MPNVSASTPNLPHAHADFLKRALARLKEDVRIVGVAAAGSFLTNSIDEFSDVDLVIVVEPHAFEPVMEQRHAIASDLGSLLAAFTGEHVGEPRLLICLYGPPPLHVDLKFVSLDDIADRVENPFVLFERDGRLTAGLGSETPRYPEPDLQWIEDRFWVWVHYAAAKIGRGELMEAYDFLGFIRGQVLGPLALKARGARPSGVRKIEFEAPDLALEMQSTLAAYDSVSCLDAIESAVNMYRRLRDGLTADALVLRREAENASMKYIEEIRALSTSGGGECF